MQQSSWEIVLLLVERLRGCAPHKALVVLCFDKDSTVLQCLCSRRLWSCRKQIFYLPGICWPQAEYDYCTRFYSSSLPVSVLSLSTFIPLLCFMCTPPHSPHSPPLFSSLIVHSWPSFKKNVEFDPRDVFPVCLSRHWYHRLCPHILPCVSILPSWHKTGTDLGMSASTVGWGVISGALVQTPTIRVWMKSLQLWQKSGQSVLGIKW